MKLMSIPRATYRLQFNMEFGFDAAAALAPYLAKLGISHVYASPYLKARPGSTHGYDIVAHDQLNPELGDAAAFQRMLDAFAEHGLKQILDFVPNHMGVGGADNPLWLDVLEWGRESSYAGWFDIEWEPHHRYLHGKILVPFLGDQYGVELERGSLSLKYDEHKGEFAVWAYDTHKLPICPLNYAAILGDSDPDLENLGDDFAALMEWRPQIGRRAGELKEQLAALISQNSAARLALAESLARFNAHDYHDAPRPELDALIQQQNWRASNFRVAGDDINYRRFFNVNELAGIRVELPDVFEHTHQLVLDLLKRGALDGVRIDHIDGLLDPLGYLRTLRQAIRKSVAGIRDAEDIYLVVEKILSHDEELPEQWPVQGTTGYEFCNLALRLLIDPKSDAVMARCYETFTGTRQRFAQVVHASKIRIMNNEMAGELNVLSREASRVARETPRSADFTPGILLRAIREVIACFTIYRTYIDGRGNLDPENLRSLESAIAAARKSEREIDPSVFDFLEKLLAGKLADPGSGFTRHKVLRCAMRLQQYSGPVMAKGLEDTAFYRFNKLIALNEVGGDPDQFGISVSQFHRTNATRAKRWPHSMLTTSTHDTKRGEDTRARLAVLADIPEDWCMHATRWRDVLMQQSGDSSIQVAHNDIYLLLQLLLGSCPAGITANTLDDAPELVAFRDRVMAALRKSVREAKQYSTWIMPNVQYEEELLRVAELALRPQQSPEFWQSFHPFLERVARMGVNNSLAQLVLKMTAPGVPDFYQGTEGWNFSLVDPDNRRAVDYVSLGARLDEIASGMTPRTDQLLSQYLSNWHDGGIKLLVTWELLQLRKAHAELFADGEYVALDVIGDRAEEICSYARRGAGHLVIVVISRFPARRESDAGWGDTRIKIPFLEKNSLFKESISGRAVEGSLEISVQVLLSVLPVAVLSTV